MTANQNPEPGISAWRQYGKTWFAGLYLIANVVITQFSGDRHIGTAEGIVISIAVGNVLLVYFIPNKTSFRWAKTLINAVLAGLAVVQILMLNGGGFGSLDENDWMLVIAAVLAVLGVTVAPSASVKQPDPTIVPTGLTTG